jgi:LysM repeat protein
MIFKFPPFVSPAATALVLASASLAVPSHAAGSGDLPQEYEQVRKIAMRDPKVRDAFERANQRLEEKIVELDPALRTYAASRRQSSPAATAAPASPAVASIPETHHTAPKPVVTHGPAAASGNTHVVAAGETIASLAHHYHVSIASLEAANHISDPRKLQTGQVLVIPESGEAKPAATKTTAHPSAATPSSAPADPQPEGLWDKLKHSF